jgi:methionyl aminopeptidase
MVRRPPIKPHPMSPTRFVPDYIEKPNYAYTGRVNTPVFSDILLHSEASIARMRTAAVLARTMLDYACSCVDVGVSTDDIDARVHEAIVARNAYPSPLNYAGFPKSLCTSVNEVICHGIPDARKLEFGDAISLDVSCYVNGVHGDNCATVIVGDYQESVGSAGVDWRGVPMKCDFESREDEEKVLAARRLVQATREALYAGIHACRPGGCLSNVGAAIHDVADAYGYDTVQKYRGHGISHEFHCPPFVKVRTCYG